MVSRDLQKYWFSSLSIFLSVQSRVTVTQVCPKTVLKDRQTSIEQWLALPRAAAA
jgi:hypothetical protein